MHEPSQVDLFQLTGTISLPACNVYSARAAPASGWHSCGINPKGCAIMRLSESTFGSLIMLTDEDAQTIWQMPPAELSLPRDEVHVWRARLDRPQQLADLRATLAPDEQARAARYYFQVDREHFTA